MRWIVLTLIFVPLLLGLQAVTAPAAAAQPGWPGDAVWPLTGAPRIVDGFDPPPQRWKAGHRGVDLAGRAGQPVRASAEGVVTFVGMIAGRSVVVVSHGRLRTTYEPVDADIAVGDRVRAGQRIGRLSAAGGHCDQPCLHWGLKEGDTYLDPTLLPTSTDVAGADEVRLLPKDAMRVAREAEAAAAAAAAAGQDADAAGSYPLRAGSHGFALPATGPITSRFGPRFHPVLHVWKLHDGTDFGAPCGSPIRVAQDGIVRQRYFNAGYGNRLIVDHGIVDGHRVQTGYNHAISYQVSPGQRVRRGQTVGRVGTTGFSTGCHLHLMMWVDGRLVDPQRWL